MTELENQLLAVLRECDEAMAYMSEYDIPLTLPDRVKEAIAAAKAAPPTCAPVAHLMPSPCSRGFIVADPKWGGAFPVYRDQQPASAQPAAVSDVIVAWSKLRHELALFCFGLSRNERAPNMEPDAFSRAIDAMVENGDCALRAVKAMLAAAPAPAQIEQQAPHKWQPIGTAPADGRTILLGHFNSHGNWRTMRGQWFTKEHIEDNWEDGDLFEAGWYETSVEADDAPSCWPTKPTHWQPLPPAPTQEAGARLAAEAKGGEVC